MNACGKMCIPAKITHMNNPFAINDIKTWCALLHLCTSRAKALILINVATRGSVRFSRCAFSVLSNDEQQDRS